MVSVDLRQRVNAPNRLPRLVYGVIIAAMMIEVAVFIIGIALGVSTGDYYANTKAVRDAALERSGILSQIGTISAVQAWLAPMKFFGLALFFSSIALALWIIIRSLQLRGEVMRVTIPAIVASRKSSGSEG